MRTERLHYDDPLRLVFTATVVGHGEHRGKASVLLDRSAFYPEAGGQMADRGTLSGISVLDVQLDEALQVHHVVSADALPAIGANVEGRIDEARRREHMALHTGQHALSRALLDELSAVTLSSRLGESACTIDVDKDGIGLLDARAVEAKVNAWIDEDRPVRQYFPNDQELQQLALRKPPPDTDRVRVVDIDGVDVTPCGGTHVTHTAQIELVRVDSVERYKGGTRIFFAAGRRARRSLVGESDLLREAAKQLGCAPPEVVSVLTGLQRKLESAREEAGALRARLAELWAERLQGEETIIATLEGADPALSNAVAQRLCTGRRLVALAAPRADGIDVVIARGPDAGTHCGELLKKVAASCGGRGGGRPEHAQGRLPAGAHWEALIRSVL